MVSEAVSAVVAYAICSASMLVINKLAVHHIPVPSFVTFCQFGATAAAVLLASAAGLLRLDPHEWNKIKYFVIYVCAFSAGTWSNMKVLMVANVETVIVFRACTPIVVSGLDYIFYGRAMPSLRSCVAMLLIAAGAVSYVLTDREFQVQGLGAYTWVAIWFCLLVFQLAFAKHLVSGLGLQSQWTPVLYTNGLALGPTSVIGLFSGEFGRIRSVELTTTGISWLLASCVVGTGISWAGFKCQSVITATAYTVVGVVNKMLTVLVNVLIWDAHASSAGIASLVVCVGGGAFYQQAPLRNKDHELRTFEYSRVKDKASEADIEDAETEDEERRRRSGA